MARPSLYDKLQAPFSGVLFERAVERALVALMGDFQVDTGEPLYEVEVWPGVRGIPKLFSTWSPNDAGGDGDEFDDAKKKASHIIIQAGSYQETDGAESCEVRIVIATHMRDGSSAAAQATQHESWCAAVRGIMAPASHADAVRICNELSDEVQMIGWHINAPAGDEYIGMKWVHSETYQVNAAMRSACI